MKAWLQFFRKLFGFHVETKCPDCRLPSTEPANGSGVTKVGDTHYKQCDPCLKMDRDAKLRMEDEGGPAVGH